MCLHVDMGPKMLSYLAVVFFGLYHCTDELSACLWAEWNKILDNKSKCPRGLLSEMSALSEK